MIRIPLQLAPLQPRRPVARLAMGTMLGVALSLATLVLAGSVWCMLAAYGCIAAITLIKSQGLLKCVLALQVFILAMPTILDNVARDSPPTYLSAGVLMLGIVALGFSLASLTEQWEAR